MLHHKYSLRHINQFEKNSMFIYNDKDDLKNIIFGCLESQVQLIIKLSNIENIN